MKIPDQDKLAEWTLQNRQGVCSNFAALFVSVARRMGIEAYFVGGYVVTKNNVRDDGHAWVACIVDGRPYITDPTWGGGYLLNDQQYVPRLDPEYFMASPAKMIATHMPSDPLFQFLDYPVYYDVIDNPKDSHQPPVYFNWRDTLNVYNQMDEVSKTGAQVQRMRNNGFPNDWIAKEINRLSHNYNAELFNRLVDRTQRAFGQMEEIVVFVNNGFKPDRNKEELMDKLGQIRDEATSCSALFDRIETDEEAEANTIVDVQRQINTLLTQIDEIEKYIRQHYNNN